jgi:4-amino-4-deoxy-L-arabinose transferase-like glycosyltransferase
MNWAFDRLHAGINSLSRHPSSTTVLVCALALVFWSALEPLVLSRNIWIYTWDSAVYLETAESLRSGRGLVHRVIYGVGDKLWEPLRLWPPGYPILIAAVQATGLTGSTSCVLISLVSGALSVVVLSLICTSLFRWSVSLPLVLTIVLTYPFLWIGTTCLSEATYFFFSVASAACLLQASRRDDTALRWMLAAGLFAGAAWETRYVAVTLFAATAIFIGCHIFWCELARVVRLALA